MRTYLLIIALAALAAAQATQPGIATQIINLPDTIKTTINDISYSLVKQRTGFTQITVLLPAAAYKDYGNIKLIVIAIPYSPEEDPDQAIRNAINKLTDTSKSFTQRVSEAIKELLSIRSVFYPYETFKVRLIFIMFVHTQTLIDYAIETSANLLNSGNVQSTAQSCLGPIALLVPIAASNFLNTISKNSKEVGATLYTNSIMEILHAKYQTWQRSNMPKLNNKINSFKLQTSQSGDTITFTGQVDEDGFRKTVLRFSVTVTVTKDPPKNNDQTRTTICKVSSSTTVEVPESFSDELANEIKRTLPTLTSEDLARVFAGKNDIDNIVNDFNEEINDFYSSIINSAKQKTHDNIESDINEIISKFNNKNFEITCSDDNCDCENVKKQMIDSILQQSSSLESGLKRHYEQMLVYIDNHIKRCLRVVDEIKNSLMPDCGDDRACQEIKKDFTDLENTVAQSIGSVAGKCVGKYLGKIAERGINSVVSTIPVANVVYIAANGIMGALQNLVTLEGKIVSEPVLAGGLGGFKVYNVSNRIACYSREIRDISGQNFVSKPSIAEAIFAAIKGFISAVTQLYGGELGEAVDLIPIIRTVDMPTDGYFMFTATPGVYVLKIRDLNARNIVDQFKQDMSCKILINLANSYNIGSNCELYKKINEKVKNVLGTTNLGNRAELYKKAGVENYDENNRDTLTLNMYFVVIPPYMAGTRFGFGYNYTLVADLFGLLRSFLSPAIGDVRRKVVTSTNFCHVSTSYISTGVVGNVVESACSSVVSRAVGVVEDAMSSVIINNLFNFENVQKRQLSCSSLGDVLVYGVKVAISEARKAIEDKITNTISENLIIPLSGRIRQSVCSWLGDQVGNQIEERLSSLLGRLLNIYGTIGSSQSQSMSYSFRASYSSDSSKLADAFCNLLGNPQIITYLGLYAVRIFDAAEEGLYVPSYFLSAYPIRFKESPTARWCYGAVASPYYVYVQPPPPARDDEKKRLLIDALDVIRTKEDLQNKFYSFLQRKKITLSVNLWLFTWNEEVDAIKEGNVACNPSFIKWQWGIPPLKIDPYEKYSWCLKEGNLAWTINSLTSMADGADLFNSLSMLRGQRMIDLPVLVGVNKYFDAFKVYPAIAVREDDDPNPYYFVVPYSTPARELFVLGTVGDVVVYDGSLKTAGGDKPFLYYNVAR
jgi:gas vesicle protein